MTIPNCVILIQARMSSARLPGKVLAPMHGRPMLAWLVESLSRCGLPLALATSIEPSDDPLASFCAESSLPCIRGPLDDVAARFALAVEQLGCDAFVRISADSPLLDPRLVDRAVALFRETKPDLVTNVFPRSYPKGQSVEVLSAMAFGRACGLMSTHSHREHITSLFYERSDEFRLENFSSGEDWGKLQTSVDTPEDFALAERLLAGLDRPHWEYGWRDLALRMWALRHATEGKKAAC